MGKTIDKYELKTIIYDGCDKIEGIVGKMCENGCDEETGELRSEAYSILHKAFEELKALAYKIY